MLPDFIIEELLRREKQTERERPQPQLQIPLAPEHPRTNPQLEDDPDRGVAIISLWD